MASRFVNSDGYAVLTGMHGHPVASTVGVALEHRVNLFDAIGYGPHLCYWRDYRPGKCAVYVNWRASGAHVLQVDHIDGDKADNSADNLAPTCRACNGAKLWAATDPRGYRAHWVPWAVRLQRHKDLTARHG